MKRIISKLAIAILAVGSSSLMAQTITVGSNAGAPGATVIVPVNFATGATPIGSIDVEVAFDNTNFSAASADCNVAAIGQNGKTCSGSLAGGKFKGSFSGDGVNAFTSGLAFNLSFTIANAATPGDKTLDALAATLTCGTPTGDDIGPPCTISLVDGKVTVSAGPQPVYGSTPGAGALNVGTVPKDGTDISTNVVINNTSGAVSTILTGQCTETADPDSVFSLSGDTTFSVPQAGPVDTVTVTCDSAGAFGAHTGTMSCAHNGSNTSPQLYNLSCTISGPVFTSNPVAGSTLTFTPTEQNDPDPTKSIAVTNTGGAGTLLDATCTDTADPDNVFSVTGGSGSIVDLGTAGPAKVVTVACDSAGTIATHTGTLTCTHNGTNAAATYPLSCQITAPGAGIYHSVPAPAATINLTPESVVTGTDVPTKSLVINNIADVNDQDLQVACDFLGGGSTQITQSPLTTSPFILEPQGSSQTANFDCDTSSPGTYSRTYSCGYASLLPTLEFKAYDAYAEYTVTCDVHAPEAVVEPQTPDGTPSEAIVAPGGSHIFSFVFNETADEGVDGTMESCDLTDGTNYAIIAPASFPAVIPAGGSLTVQVEGTDPGGVDSFADTLNCTYSDGPLEQPVPVDDHGESGGTVSYPLNIIIGGDGSFNVRKEFSDGPGNPTEVVVTISCNTGLPLIQSQTISETQDVTFIVTSFETGVMDCSITEDLSDPALAGYTPSYYNEEAAEPDSESCAYVDVAGGDDNVCLIVNTVNPVPVVITKDWIIDGIGGDQIDQHFELTLYCDSGEIVGGYNQPHSGYGGCGSLPGLVANGGTKGYGQYESCLELDGVGNTTFTPEVIPEWPSTYCWVEEEVYDDAVEVDNDCGSIYVSHGQGDECVITNTVFFEGIPTLSQYGMVILALLMLGVGLVGFRRFI